MKKLIFTLLAFVTLCACTHSLAKNEVKFTTTAGDIIVKLYDETPLHRDNFLKLAREGAYDSVLFHRVIKDFMIQTGDPNSKTAGEGVTLGSGGPGYTVPAEIVYPQTYHKKGALAAARQGDNVNPTKNSSGSQFYIAVGKVYTDEELVQVEERMQEMSKQSLFYSIVTEYTDTLTAMKMANDQTGLLALQTTIMDRVSAEATKLPTVKIPEDLKKVYKTIGGVPFLDTQYTVFGEVVKGLNIVDSIAAVKCNGSDRPLVDIRILKVEVGK